MRMRMETVPLSLEARLGADAAGGGVNQFRRTDVPCRPTEHRYHRCSVLLLPLLALAACAGPGSGGPGAASTAVGMDAQFVQAAYQDNLAEELASSYAETKAQSPAIKAFATRMMTDHDNMAIGVKQLAIAQGMTVPTSPSDAQLAEIKAVSNNDGDAFDKAYVADEIKRHRAMLQAYQTEAASGNNPAIKRYASDRLAVVRYNLSAVEALHPGA